MLITIGRDASCSFVIDSPRVSGSHCQIRFMADRFEVTDLGSSNGTFVGVERTRVMAPTTVFPGQPLFLGTIEVSPTEVAGRFGLQWPAAVPAAAPRASGAGLIVVGRDGSCDFVIDSPKISGRHCQLRFAGDRVEVTDLGSSNGTFVGDDRVRVQGTVAVFPGQSVFMSTVPLPIEEIARRNGVTWAAAGRPAPATVMDSQPSGAEVARLAAERAALEQERMRLEQARMAAAAPLPAAPVAAPVAAPAPVYAAQPKAAQPSNASSHVVGIILFLIIVIGGVGAGMHFIDSIAEKVEGGASSAAPGGGDPAPAPAPAPPPEPEPPVTLMNETRILTEGSYSGKSFEVTGVSEITISVNASPKAVDFFLMDDENWGKFQAAFDAGRTGGYDYFTGLSSKNVLAKEMTAELGPRRWHLIVQRPRESAFVGDDTTATIIITRRDIFR